MLLLSFIPSWRPYPATSAPRDLGVFAGATIFPVPIHADHSPAAVICGVAHVLADLPSPFQHWHPSNLKGSGGTIYERGGSENRARSRAAVLLTSVAPGALLQRLWGVVGRYTGFTWSSGAWEAVSPLLEPARGASLLWALVADSWGQSGDDQSPHRLLEPPTLPFAPADLFFFPPLILGQFRPLHNVN
ncbi:uncharacterized protein N7473_010901 [Penicillium subrubescens]|uniref:uncharacterized protein n=1 Tax=Penicillium subrubescens TaxID=1316194 RepID=UPI0025452D5F|nr:uncharacterized protein N7473_010901 [Penicillium subrubescens]KAJ5884015.1 hypothetical protein N7473_010901 [Penicillium subrubescens]